jgi:flagellin-specific chaperone FliS
MFVARKKRKENVIEYIIYMFQIQDVIRAYGLSKGSIESNLLTEYKVSSEEDLLELKEWYFGIIDQLVRENKQDNGILQTVQNIINDVNELHLWLINSPDYKNYRQLFEKVQPYLLEYKVKLKGKSSNDIELAIDLMYNYVLLKMKRHQISEETQLAVQEVSNFLNKLARFYVQYENGEIQID